jgi:histidyl-tRNA synthetase
MGGPRTPSVGWASGMERLVLLFAENFKPEKKSSVAVISAEENANPTCFFITQELRAQNIPAEFITGSNMGKKFKKADKLGAHWALVLGSQEISSGTFMLKDLKTGQQQAVTREQLFQTLQQKN